MFKTKNFTHRRSFFSRYMKARYCTYDIHIHRYIIFYLCIIIKNDLSNQINNFKNNYMMQKYLHIVTFPSAVFLKIVLLYYDEILMLFCSQQLALVHAAAMNYQPSQGRGHHTVLCYHQSHNVSVCMKYARVHYVLLLYFILWLGERRR